MEINVNLTNICYNCKNIEVLFNGTKWCNRKGKYVEYTDVCEDFEENN